MATEALLALHKSKKIKYDSEIDLFIYKYTFKNVSFVTLKVAVATCGNQQKCWAMLYYNHISNLGLKAAQMIAIKGGTELLLYGGGFVGVVQGEIWKHHVVSGLWSRIGDLFKGR